MNGINWHTCRARNPQPQAAHHEHGEHLLPDTLRDFVDQQVRGTGYGTSSEYVRELLRRDLQRQQLRALLLDGAQAPATGQADARYFAGLRQRIAAKAVPPQA